MTGYAIHLVGETFGRLTVLARAGHDPHGHVLWLAKCACGARLCVRTQSLRSGATRSCGCYQRERVAVARSVRRARRAV